MNLTEYYPTHETLASACEFAAGMVKAQGADTDKPACDLELHLNLAAKRLREIGLAPADGVWMPLAAGANTDELVGNLMRACGADPADDDDRARLDRMENFLEIAPRTDGEANTLDNRLTDYANANMEAMNSDLDIAVRALEERLSARLAALESRLTDLEANPTR